MPIETWSTEQRHSDEIHEIITAPPSWILRWGTMLFFSLLCLMIFLSAVIKYPDTVSTNLKINSYNSPKAIVAKTSGKLVNILINENQLVEENQVIAYIESTASHDEIINLRKLLKDTQSMLYGERTDVKLPFETPFKSKLGELQASYQNFYQSYLLYKSSIRDGFLVRKKMLLKKDILNIKNQKDQLLAQQSLQQKDYNLAQEEYRVHKILFEQKVEPLLEFKREEAKSLAKEYPLQQTKSALIQNDELVNIKNKELLELDNQISDEKLKFSQALSTLISLTDDWLSKYTLIAYQSGRVAFAGIVQQNQFVHVNQEVFYINPLNSVFFGEINIRQYNMGKISRNQKVIIRLKSYPYEEYGVLWGKLDFISDVPVKDSVFIAKVAFKNSDVSNMRRHVTLKNGMLADAEIITDDVSLLHRLFDIIFKMKRY